MIELGKVLLGFGLLLVVIGAALLIESVVLSILFYLISRFRR